MLTIAGLSAQSVAAQDYDLVILGGRVMDAETRYDGVANVGIWDGRIAVITREKIEGKRKSRGLRAQATVSSRAVGQLGGETVALRSCDSDSRSRGLSYGRSPR